MLMMSPESHGNGHFCTRQSIGEPSGATWKIHTEARKKGEIAPKEEEEGMGEEGTGENIKEEKHCYMNINYNNLYVNMVDKIAAGNKRDATPIPGPPLPPRMQPATIGQDELFYLYPAWEGMTDRRKSKEIHGEQAEGYFEQSEEEDPYTSAQANDCVYDTILANANKGRRKEGKSFIMNRPPAPAPRPPSPVIIQEERTPYIVQVFQKQKTRIHAGNEKLLCAVENKVTVSSDRITYTTVKPLGHERLILLREQVKRERISVDDPPEKSKQWQTHKSGLEATQQEKIHQLRDSTARKILEEKIMYADKVNIVHPTNVSLARRNHFKAKEVYPKSLQNQAPI